MRSFSWLRPPMLFSGGAAVFALAVGACSGTGFTNPIETTATDQDAGIEEDAGELADVSTKPDATPAVMCKGAREDCNKSATDGCEVDTASNPKHCGACARACPGGEVCALGKCTNKCPSQLKTCGAACVDTSISVDHCGGCSKPCTAPSDATAICEASACGFQCNAGFEACSTGCCAKPPSPPTPTLQAGAALAAAGNHSCAIVTGGALKCWGSNGSGKLGDNTMSDRRTATKVQGLTSGVSAVGCGDVHTCALLASGEVRCWGGNTFGQLGTGDSSTTATSKSPATVSGLSSGAVALGVGRDFACAIVAGGGVKCWGANARGQLGDGSNDDSTTPVDVTGLTRPAVALALGSYHACALHDDGSMSCWGANERGQLGDASTDDRTSAVAVANLPTGVVTASAGFAHSCVRTSASAVHCWGDNDSGQLGNGSTVDSTSPVEVTNLGSVVAIDNGSFHTCGVIATGEMKCWGSNTQGQLGTGTTTGAATPADVVSLSPASMTDVAAGSGHTCARTQGGNVKCWGANSRGQLGNGTTNASATPVNVQGI